MFNDEGTKNEHWTFTAYILYTVGLNSNASKNFIIPKMQYFKHCVEKENKT